MRPDRRLKRAGRKGETQQEVASIGARNLNPHTVTHSVPGHFSEAGTRDRNPCHNRVTVIGRGAGTPHDH